MKINCNQQNQPFTHIIQLLRTISTSVNNVRDGYSCNNLWDSKSPQVQLLSVTAEIKLPCVYVDESIRVECVFLSTHNHSCASVINCTEICTPQ